MDSGPFSKTRRMKQHRDVQENSLNVMLSVLWSTFIGMMPRMVASPDTSHQSAGRNLPGLLDPLFPAKGSELTVVMARLTRYICSKDMQDQTSTKQVTLVIVISNPGQRQSQNLVQFLSINIHLVFIL